MVLHFDFCVINNAIPAKSMHIPYDIMVKLRVIFEDRNHDDRWKEQGCPRPELYTQAVASVVYPKETVCQGYVTSLCATCTSTLIPKPNTEKGSNKSRAILEFRNTIYVRILKTRAHPEQPVLTVNP